MGAVTGAEHEVTVPGGGRTDAWRIPGFVDRRLGRFNQDRTTKVIVALAAMVAFVFRWTQDDSFITLRYARNLAEGRGLVYNPGDNVEGYTNFLWTVLMAIPLKFGRDPILFGHIVGVACMVVSLVALVKLATRVFGSAVLGNLTALVLLTNTTFVAYGTGGLETQLQTALVMLVWLLALPVLMRDDSALRTRDLALISVLSGLALLTRLDSAVVIAVPAVAVAWSVIRSDTRRPTRLLALVLPVVALVAPWTVWRVATYGSFVPNTAVAKENPLGTSLLQGGLFLAVFIGLNLLFAFAPTAIVHGRKLLSIPPFVPVLIALGLWTLYLLKVGADFMEFRFMVVVLPLISLVLVALISLTISETWQKLLTATLIFAMFFHFAVMGATGGIANLDGVGELDDYVTNPLSGEKTLGEELRTVLHGSEDAEERGSGAAVIASGAAGAVPYYARLRSVDPLGLNDAWTARHGIRLDSELVPKQGHSRMATFEHLNDEGVNLLFGWRGQPRDGYGPDDLRSIFRDETPDTDHLRDDATMIEIPMADGTVYTAIYMNPHPDIDAAIEAGRWTQVPISR